MTDQLIKKILSGEITHTETICLWIGKIKIKKSLLLDWTEQFLNFHHHSFIGKNPEIKYFVVEHQHGGQWFGPKQIRFHVLNKQNPANESAIYMITKDNGYLDKFFEFVNSNIINYLGVEAKIHQEKFLNDLSKTFFSQKDRLITEHIEFHFEIDLIKTKMKNFN